MHTLTVKLKQHTPLIHFQHDQEGATLRASEVKPKLDKYILSQLTPEEMAQGEREDWIKSKNDKEWLDYKMRIIKPKVALSETGWNKSIKDERLYFGNMNSDNPKDFSYCKSLIDLIIITSNTNLFVTLNHHIVDFFLINNFGTRQSKGFGSFSIYSINGDEKMREIPNGYVSFYKTSSNDVFSDIEWIHKTLRSGINGRSSYSLYFKSLLFSYAENEIWDKKSIKSHFLSEATKKNVETNRASNLIKYNNGRRTAILPYGSDPQRPKEYAHWHTPDNTTSGKYDMRDYLGLSTSETWMAYDTGVFELKRDIPKTKFNKRLGKEEYVLEKMRVSKSLDSKFKDTSRFKSPILYKPIEQKDGTWRVYIFVDEESLSFLDKKTIHYRCNMPNAEDFSLTMWPGFSVRDFLRWAFTLDEKRIKSNFSVNKYPFNPQRHHNEEEINNYNRIIKLYSELRRNIK